jgi:hypothetical protein
MVHFFFLNWSDGAFGSDRVSAHGQARVAMPKNEEGKNDPKSSVM